MHFMDSLTKRDVWITLFGLIVITIALRNQTESGALLEAFFSFLALIPSELSLILEVMTQQQS